MIILGFFPDYHGRICLIMGDVESSVKTCGNPEAKVLDHHNPGEMGHVAFRKSINDDKITIFLSLSLYIYTVYIYK